MRRVKSWQVRMRTKRITTEMANAAMKNFLNMNEDQIRDALTDSLQGNMREIIGTQCLKELCNDRKTFGDEVQAKAQKDMNALGIWIESCNIQKIEDENNLITALGQDNMSQIQKDASVAKAQADRDVAIARAQAQKDANDAQVIAETEIAQKTRTGHQESRTEEKSPISRRQKLTQHTRSRKRNSVRPWKSPQQMQIWPVRRRNWS